MDIAVHLIKQNFRFFFSTIPAIELLTEYTCPKAIDHVCEGYF